MTKKLADSLPLEKWKIMTGKHKKPVKRIIESIYRERANDGKTYVFWHESRYSEAGDEPISTYLSSVGRDIDEEGNELEDRSEFELNAKNIARVKPLITAATNIYDWNRNCAITAKELFTIEPVAETPLVVAIRAKTEPTK